MSGRSSYQLWNPRHAVLLISTFSVIQKDIFYVLWVRKTFLLHNVLDISYTTYVIGCKMGWDQTSFKQQQNEADCYRKNYGTKRAEFLCFKGLPQLRYFPVSCDGLPQKPRIERQEPFSLQYGFIEDKFLFIYWHDSF